MAVDAKVVGARKKPRMTKAEKREAWTFYFLISPWMIGFLVFIGGPMIASLIFSFMHWDMLTAPRWIGLTNYKMALHDPLLWQALKVTVIYAFFAVPLGLVVGLAMAMLLNQGVRGIRIFRTLFYLPAVVSGVAVMVLWMYIFNPQVGLLNTVLGWFGIPGPGWIESTRWALPALIIMSLWSAGSSMVIWLAGLQGIPQYLYESASLDGAGAWKKFINVTLPMLSPTIFFNLIMGIIGAMQTFGQAYVMTQGGPLNSTLFLEYYLFTNAFVDFKMGYASALAWIMFFIILILSLLVIRSSNAWVYYEGEKR